MATGHLKTRKCADGTTSYQLVVETDRDPITGKRQRFYKTVKGTKKQANAMLRQMIFNLQNGTVTTPSAIKLSSWMNTWLNTYLPNIELTTRDGYEEKIKNYIIPALGHIPLNALNNQTIQSWILSLSNKGLSPKTIRNAYNNLNAALKKAVVLRMIPYNPCDGTELPKLEKHEARVYSISDIQKALAAADNVAMYMMILLGATLGLRRGEMAALRWNDVNFDKNTVSITTNRVHANRQVVQKAPKTKASRRTITVGADVMDALREAKALYDVCVATTPGFRDLGYIVWKEKTGEPYHPDSLTQKWERFVEKNGLPPLCLHGLRHSNATALIASGVSAKVVQHRLGHSDISVTLNTYAHVLPCMDEDAASKLDQALFSSGQTLNHLPLR